MPRYVYVEKLSDTPSAALWLTSLERPFALASPFGGEPFVLFLQVSLADITEEEQAAVSKALVLAGCRYACCNGARSSTWDDSIDEAAVEEFLDAEIPDDRFVMTTWHESDTLRDALRFFRGVTLFDGTAPRNFLVVLLGANQGLEAEIRGELAKIFPAAR